MERPRQYLDGFVRQRAAMPRLRVPIAEAPIPAAPLQAVRTDSPARTKSKSTSKRLSSRRLWVYLASVLVALALLAAVSLLLLRRQSATIPAIIRQQAGFQLYFPQPLPTGLTYVKGSARMSDSIIFYDLRDTSGAGIHISEQAIPLHPPSPLALEQIGFHAVDADAGTAELGTANKQPVGIIITHDGLITITGDTTTPRDELSKVIKSLSSLPRS